MGRAALPLDSQLGRGVCPATTAESKERIITRWRIFLALASFAIYAFAIIHQGHYLLVRCGHECEGAWTGALSFSVYGAKLGNVESNTHQVFPPGGNASQGIEQANKGTIETGHAGIATDGIGIGYLIFSSLAMKIFGPHLVSMTIAFLVLLGVSSIAFILRFRDGRLFAIPMLFLALSFMLLTWQNTSREAIQEGTPGGYRFMVVLAILPALHIMFEILDRSGIARAPGRMTVSRLLLLAVQAGLLAFVLIVRSSIAYVFVPLVITALVSASRSWRRGLGIDRIAQITACGLIVGALTLAAMTQSVSPEYAKEGRLFGNIWHRVVISLSMHAAWPFGRLQEMYPCLNSTRWDPVGWCVWQVSQGKGAASETLEDSPSYYDRGYEDAMRAAFFRVLAAYPKQVFETLYYDKTVVLIATLRDALTLSWVDIPAGILPLFLLQALVFGMFVAASSFAAPVEAVPHRAVLSGLLLASAIPGYIAWPSLGGSADIIVFMYALVALGLAVPVQTAVLAVAGRSPAVGPAIGAGSLIAAAVALAIAINRYNFGEIDHPLLAKRPVLSIAPPQKPAAR